jgi:hypothetical protein
MFPLSGVFVPGDPVALRVFETRYIAMCRDILAGDEMIFGTVIITAGSEVGGDDRRGSVGVTVAIDQMFATEDGGYSLAGVAQNRIRIDEWLIDDPYPQAMVTEIVSLPVFASTIEPADRSATLRDSYCSQMTMQAQRLRTLLQEVAQRHNLRMDSLPPLTRIAGGQWWTNETTDQTVERGFWELVRHTPCGPYDRYALLQSQDLVHGIQTLNRVIDEVSDLLGAMGDNG